MFRCSSPIADRLIALDLGEIVTDGSPDTSYDDPRGREVVPRHDGRRGDRTQWPPRTARTRTANQHRPAGDQGVPHGSRVQGSESRHSGVTLPVIAVVVVVASSIGAIGIISGGTSRARRRRAVDTTRDTAPSFKDVPIVYSEAKAAGTLDKYTWRPTCDKTTGHVEVPILDPPPCVPSRQQALRSTPTRRTASPSPRSRSATTSRSPTRGRRPHRRRAVGAYDSPSQVGQGAPRITSRSTRSVYSCTAARSSSSSIRAAATVTDEKPRKADADEPR